MMTWVTCLGLATRLAIGSQHRKGLGIEQYYETVVQVMGEGQSATLYTFLPSGERRE